jgi:hypothetical protein
VSELGIGRALGLILPAVIKKVKSLNSVKHCAVITYGRVEVQLHTFTLGLDGDDQVHALVILPFEKDLLALTG